MTRITLTTAVLSAALDAVHFAARPTGDVIPSGVLFETGDGAVTLVATDRFRLAVATAPAEVEGPPARIFLPLAFTEQLRDLPDGPVTVDLTTDRVRAQAGDRTVEEKPVDMTFPDYRRLVGPAGPESRSIPVDVAGLRELLSASPVVDREHEGSSYPVSILGLNPAGSLRLAAESEWAADADAHVAVNREFLLEALDAGGPGQLVLELDGPVKPLVLRVPGDESRFSLLMPVRP